MTERESLLILNAVHLLDARRIRQLMICLGSAVKVLESSLKDLKQCWLLTPQMIENIFNFSKDKFLQDEYNLMQRWGVSALTCVDDDFPCSLNFEDAPVVLYVKGQKECLHQRSMAIVGSRAASYYGIRSARRFAQNFVQADFAVVSGLARGIDTAAHQGALEAGGKTIAIIGCGLNYIYPKENHSLMQKIAEEGAVVSEYAFSMPPLRHNFPWRNRIISGLSEKTVVIEAGKNSGALITANYALAQNKDVFVLPGNIDTLSALGSNRLIQDGAMVALGPDDVIMGIKENGVLGPKTASETKIPLDEKQQKVYAYISQEPIHVDELSKITGLSISILWEIMLSLELKRVIRPLPGQYYVRD